MNKRIPLDPGPGGGPANWPEINLHAPLRLDSDILPKAPLEIHQATVLPEWIDYNGHLNMAYYVLMFDNATDRFFDLIGLGTDYAAQSRHSAFVLETHVTYQKEVSLGDSVRFTFQLIDTNDKCLHFYLEMFHASQGFLAATSEQIILHMDLNSRRPAIFPNDMQQRIAAVRMAHAHLPKPQGVGRTIGIRARI